MWATRHSPLSKHDLAEQQLSFLSSSDPTHLNTKEEQNTAKFGNKPEETQSTSINPSGLSPSQETSRPLVSYGIDWSDHAHPTSHCWLPYSFKDSSCKKDKSAASPLAECPVCSLIIHTEHLADHLIPLCRSSFMDSNAMDDISSHDRHQWSPCTSVCSKRCEHCNDKLLSDAPNDGGHPTSSAFTCLWCSRCYHRRCWESISEDGDKNKCDYGVFGEIVVRPQWLHRVPCSPAGFRAQMSHCSVPVTPVIFFINKASGGQKGEKIYRQMVHLLNPRQIFLLENDATIEQALNIYSSLANVRICICGGDGTVEWVLSRLAETFPSLQNPPAGICPLGTGNDLSRVLGWGYQYDPKRFLRMLTQISRAQPVALDRWQIQIQPLETVSENENAHQGFFSFRNPPKFIRNADEPLYENHRTPTKTHFFNYMSFGLDAAVVLDFHVHRTLDSTKYTSPFKNKLLYVSEARKYFKEFAFGIGWNLASYLRLICDGRDLTDSIRSCHTLVLLNIPGFGSGTRPWGRTLTNIGQFERQDFGDQKLEVLGLNTKQMALIHLGFRGDRIAQCRQVRIELTHPMPVHMDGEPFYLPGSIALHVTHAGQVMVLRNENR